MDDEQVVLLDEAGESIGTAPKASVHHDRTPLHLAFSSYLFDADGRLLLTRRALGKRTWGGVWTNSCCGHPAPGEPLADAVRRRVSFELGATVTGLRLALPDFRYRAERDGVVENEVCPVFVGLLASAPAPRPDEVMDLRWVSWEAFLAGDPAAVPAELSPWCLLQRDRLRDNDEVRALLAA